MGCGFQTALHNKTVPCGLAERMLLLTVRLVTSVIDGTFKGLIVMQGAVQSIQSIKSHNIKNKMCTVFQFISLF